MRYWRKRHEGLDLEAELRAGRPEPESSSSIASKHASGMTVVAASAQARFASPSSVH